MKHVFLTIFLLIFAGLANAQSTTVSATITDAGTQLWKNGTYSFSFKPAPSNPTSQYYWNGSPFSSTQTIQGVLDGTASFSVSVPSNTSITPSGSFWVFQACPAATATNGCYSVSVTITGATQSLTSVVPPAVIVNLATPFAGASAYSDSEITGAKTGGSYWNLTDNTFHVCSGFPPCTWLSMGGSSASILPSNNTFTGTNTFSVPIIGNITGNAATANTATSATTATTATTATSAGSATNATNLVGPGTITGPYTSTFLNNTLTVNNPTSATVNAAITSATSGQTVQITGSFTLSLGGSLLLNQAGVTLQCTNGAKISTPNSFNASLIQIAASNTRVTGCLLDGNKANQTAGFAVQFTAQVDHIDIDNNQIQNIWNECIALNNVSHLRITKNRLSNCTQGGNNYAIDYSMGGAPTSETVIDITDNDIDGTGTPSGGINLGASVASGQISRFHLDRNTITVGDNTTVLCPPVTGTACPTIGIQVFTAGLSSNVIAYGTVNNNVITGQNFTNLNTWGISVGTAGVLNPDIAVTGNVIAQARYTCIEGIGGGLTITGNSCDGTDGIQVPANHSVVNGVVVANNTLTNGTGVGTGINAQIGVSASPTFAMSGIVVAHNSLFNVPINRRAILFGGSSTGLIQSSIIEGNEIIGQNASMASPAIQLSQSVRIAVRHNSIFNWIGSGTSGVEVDSSCTGCVLDANEFANVTANWTDNASGTLINEHDGVAFASLGSQGNGSILYCNNCTVTTPGSCSNVTNTAACTCTSGGSGALARRLNGVWICN